MALHLFARRAPLASALPLTGDAAAQPRRRPRLLRLVTTDPRVAALAATWYAAFLLGWQPGIEGAIAMVVLFPVLLMLCLIGFLFLPQNLLDNLRVELSGPLHDLYFFGYLAAVVGLHVWLYFTWRWRVMALLAVVLCVSSYGCYARSPEWHHL